MSQEDCDYSEEYAKCYDFITQHKDYDSEVDSLLKLLQSFRRNKKIVSVGCGTGTHEIKISKLGYSVFGIDKSVPMLKRALSKSRGLKNVAFGTNFYEAETHLGAGFDCVVSLFNVINCIHGLHELHEFFQEVHSRMDSGGVFFFEAWNGIECLINPPQFVKRVFGDTIGNYLTRKAMPCLRPSDQRLDIKYDISGFLNNKEVKLESTHRLRLFSVNEILFLLSSAGFSSVKVYSSLPELKPFQHDSLKHPRMLAFLAVA
jgi:SAM-dependent methyltransferase